MFIRAMNPDDLDRLRDIDATIESLSYIHLEFTGEGLSRTWKTQQRNFREKLIEPNVMNESTTFLARQIATGMDEGVAMVSEFEDNLIGSMLARFHPENKTIELADIRIDYDYRRQGMGLALAYQLVAIAREKEMRAIYAESRTNNFPFNQFLIKCGFELSGVDTKRHSDHDLVKEMATLLWYLPIS